MFAVGDPFYFISYFILLDTNLLLNIYIFEQI